MSWPWGWCRTQLHAPSTYTTPPQMTLFVTTSVTVTTTYNAVHHLVALIKGYILTCYLLTSGHQMGRSIDGNNT